MEYTGSVSKGKPAPVHNRRECRVDNADPALRDANEVLLDDDLREAYEQVFGTARVAYNEAQVAKGHAERQVDDYLDKVQADKQLQAVYEMVVAVGSMDSHPPVEVAKEVYRDWLAMFQAKMGDHFRVVQCIIHADEPGACHAHLEYFPIADSKRGLARQNSMSKALQQAGYKGQNGYNLFVTDLQGMLTECMAAHGIERIEGDKANQRGGINIGAYKRLRAAEEQAEELEGKVDLLKEGHRRCEAVVVHPLKNAPDVARFAREAREAAEAAEALAGEVARLSEQCSASERREAELAAEVGSLRRTCRDAGGVVDRLLAAAGDLKLRVSAAWRDSAIGKAVLGLLDGHRYELGTVNGYVPGGLELRAVDGQLQRLREAARRQREQRQPDITRQRPTQTR